jgi:hypothetical protein
MPDYEQCSRCGKQLDIESDEFSDAEVIDEQLVCESCMTAQELAAIDADDEAMAGAMEAAGLGLDSDPEAMTEAEYKMREELATVFSEQSVDDKDGA